MKALIATEEFVSFISGWDESFEPAVPSYTQVGNRIVQLCEKEFETHPSLIWVDVDPSFDLNTSAYIDGGFITIPVDSPKPTPKDQPISTGVQTL